MQLNFCTTEYQFSVAYGQIRGKKKRESINEKETGNIPKSVGGGVNSVRATFYSNWFSVQTSMEFKKTFSLKLQMFLSDLNKSNFRF